MNTIELKEHIQHIEWDDDFSSFYEDAKSGNPEDVFDLFILEYVDNNNKIDNQLLEYCSSRGHKLAEYLIENGFLCKLTTERRSLLWDKIIEYYKSFKNSGKRIWLLGLCYQETNTSQYESLKFVFNDNIWVQGRKQFVLAFECYINSGLLNFPLGWLDACYYCQNPDSYDVFIKDSDKLFIRLKEKLMDLGYTSMQLSDHYGL